MKQTLLQQTEREVKELFFLISPPRHIKSDVSVLKDDVEFLIGRKTEDRYSTAHISLFKYSDRDERRMLHMMRFVQARAMSIEPFNVFIKDFGTCHNGDYRTVYLDIVNKTPIQEVFEKTVKEDENFIPHLPIAKKLTVEEYYKCWPYLKNLRYSNQHFLCDRITVLARGENERKWSHYKDIMFGG
jgi:2'-5' RNA ligase